jgi:hypothetical protein
MQFVPNALVLLPTWVPFLAAVQISELRRRLQQLSSAPNVSSATRDASGGVDLENESGQTGQRGVRPSPMF